MSNSKFIDVLICIVHQGLVSVHRIVHCSDVVVLALVLYERLLLLLAIVVGSFYRVLKCSEQVHISMYVSSIDCYQCEQEHDG